MTSFEQLVSRVRRLLEVTETLVPDATVEDWISRAVADLSDIAERMPALWDTLRPLMQSDAQTVGDTKRLLWPADALRVRGTGTVDGYPFARLVRGSELPAVNAYRRPTRTSPWLMILSDSNGDYLEILPRVFGGKQARLDYIRQPKTEDSFGDLLADLIVARASGIGAMERGDRQKLEVSDKMLAGKLQLIAPEVR